jgi:NitT/TauT family transport system substrate-binding protein
MTIRRSRALRLIGGAVAAPAAVAGFPAVVKSQALTVVKVGIIPVDVAANVFYAQDLGLFAKAGLDVQTQAMSSGPVLAQAVAAGAIDIGISNVATIGAARLRGLPFRFVAPAAVVLPGAKPTDVVMVAQDSTLRPGPSLNGKTIAINGLKDLQEIEARGWVDKFGGDSNTIKFVEVPFPAMGGALQEKRADIIFPTEPFSTADTNVGKVIGDAFDGVGPRFLLLGWFAANSWLTAHPDVAAKFVTALRAASDWANNHHSESAQMLVSHTKIPAEVAQKMVRATYGLALEPAMLTPVLNLALRYGLIAQPVPANDLIWRPPGG